MIAPGMKVAARVKTAPHMLAIGKVTPDGTGVIWHDIVDMADGHAHHSHYGSPMRFDKKPRPLTGDEVPCPPELAHLIPA